MCDQYWLCYSVEGRFEGAKISHMLRRILHTKFMLGWNFVSQQNVSKKQTWNILTRFLIYFKHISGIFEQSLSIIKMHVLANEFCVYEHDFCDN